MSKMQTEKNSNNSKTMNAKKTKLQLYLLFQLSLLLLKSVGKKNVSMSSFTIVVDILTFLERKKISYCMSGT